LYLVASLFVSGVLMLTVGVARPRAQDMTVAV